MTYAVLWGYEINESVIIMLGWRDEHVRRNTASALSQSA